MSDVFTGTIYFDKIGWGLTTYMLFTEEQITDINFLTNLNNKKFSCL
jgi:hypothetical protein